jgi:hypothetical protein
VGVRRAGLKLTQLKTRIVLSFATGSDVIELSDFQYISAGLGRLLITLGSYGKPTSLDKAKNKV